MPAPLDVEALRRSVVLGALPQAELEELAGLMRRRTFRRGEVIFHEGDAGDTLHVVVEGRVKVVIIPQPDEEVILTIMGPGEHFGEIALLDGGPRSAKVEALEPVVTASLRRTDFLDLLHRSPQAVDGLLAGLARIIRRETDELADLASLDVNARLAKKLLELAEAHGRPVEGAIEIELPLTQGELAAMISATRPVVNRLLGLYEEQGVIVRRGRRLALLQPEQLRSPGQLTSRGGAPDTPR